VKSFSVINLSVRILTLIIPLPMTDFTPKKNMKLQAKETVKKMNESMKETLHASSDALFFVRLFARACNPTPQAAI
jgi:hypothetical protein